MKIDSFQRFLDAQGPIYAEVLAELSAGKKLSHWMWFIFPQHVALGTSDRAKRFGLYGLEQAREYFEHPVLGKRLLECCCLVLRHSKVSIERIFGDLDAKKFHSSISLFALAVPNEQIFKKVLDIIYQGALDLRTVTIVNKPF